MTVKDAQHGKILFVDTHYGDAAFKFDALVISATTTTTALPCRHLRSISAAISCPATGSPSYTAKLQGSNDQSLGQNQDIADSNVSNWFDVPTGGNRVVSVAIAAAGTFILSDDSCAYRWYRLVLTKTSGSMTTTITVQGKEV